MLAILFISASMYAVPYAKAQVSGRSHTVTLGQDFSDSVQSNVVSLVRYDLPQYILQNVRLGGSQALRVRVDGWDATADRPLHVAVTHGRASLSWQIPLRMPIDTDGDGDPDGETLHTHATRTLCPETSPSSHVLVTLSTTSPYPLRFRLRVFVQTPFGLTNGTNYTVSDLSPASPHLFYFRHPEEEEMDVALLRVTSEDNLCMTLSVQNVSCPVHDDVTDLGMEYDGIYQTATTRAGLTFAKRDYPLGAFVVMMVKGDDTACKKGSLMTELEKACGPGAPCRTKTVTFSIESRMTHSSYVLPTLSVLGFFATIFFFIWIMYCCCWSSEEEHAEDAEESAAVEPLTNNSHHQTVDDPDEVTFLSQLVDKSSLALDKRSSHYRRYLLVCSVFYALPVVQLVLQYSKVSDATGNQDLCYYNHLCAHQLGPLVDFNHVYSNVGYVVLGVLFMIITRKKKVMSARSKPGYGIPQHFGLYYAMGLALITEGFMSAFYHICPSDRNFQFDTAFMYAISVIMLLKTYQNRHPVLNAHAYSAFLVLALIIFVCVVGVIHGNDYVYGLFTTLRLIIVPVLSIQVYYKGRWKNPDGKCKVLVNLCNFLKCNCGDAFKPKRPERFWVLLTLNVFNLGFSVKRVCTWYEEDFSFASYILDVLIANFVVYIVAYVILKMSLDKSADCRRMWQPFAYLLLSLSVGAAAMYFFASSSYKSSLAPAQSRHHNWDCSLLDFYDYHDVWHFLSALSLFFFFMTLLTLDDDLAETPWSEIRIF